MTWFKSLKRSSQIAVVLLLFACAGIAAYAAGVLWNSAHSNTSLSKEHFLTVQLSGASASGSIKPGGSVALAPTVTNSGDVDAGVFIRVSMPIVDGSPAYEFEAGSGWNLVSSSGGVQVWSYGTESVLESLSPGSSTNPLTETGFTMKNSITGVEFAELESVDVSFDGYLVEYTAIDGMDPENAWAMVPAE